MKEKASNRIANIAVFMVLLAGLQVTGQLPVLGQRIVHILFLGWTWLSMLWNEIAVPFLIS